MYSIGSFDTPVYHLFDTRACYFYVNCEEENEHQTAYNMCIITFVVSNLRMIVNIVKGQLID